MSTNKMREALKKIARYFELDDHIRRLGLDCDQGKLQEFYRLPHPSVTTREALADDDAERGAVREEFEAWFERYHTEACEQFGGIDCTNPKGIAEDAWQASRAAAPQAGHNHAPGWTVQDCPACDAAPQSVEPVADPLDTPLPCAVDCGGASFGKGVKLRLLVNAARRWREDAYGPSPTGEEADRALAALQGRSTHSAPTDAEYVAEGMRLHELVKHHTLAADNFSRGDEKYRAHLDHARIGTEALCAHLSTRPAQAVVNKTPDYAKDAEEWGDSLNEASWAFLDACPEKSALLLSTAKISLREAIKVYLRSVDAAMSAPPTKTKEPGHG